MAKITFPDPDDAQYLETGGDNIYPRGQKIFVRKKPLQVPKKTPARKTVHDHLKDLSTLWSTLSPAEKAAWQTYSTHLAAVNSAYKAFLKINTQLLRPGIPSITPLRSLSSPPQDPHPPTGFHVTFLPAISQFCVSWTHPSCAGNYVKAWKWTPPGKQRASAQPFTYLGYAISSAHRLLVDAEFYDVDRKDQITIRALNLRGELSDFTPYIQDLKTAHRSGRYGITSYGYSHYGA